MRVDTEVPRMPTININEMVANDVWLGSLHAAHIGFDLSRVKRRHFVFNE